MHKQQCADAALHSMRLAVESGVPISVWKNINKLSKRRNEGMRLILVSGVLTIARDTIQKKRLTT
jgi:hypothetical protein